MWVYYPLGNNTYEKNIYEYVRDGTITVIRDDITSLENQSINFRNTPSVPVDGLVFATGYKQDCEIFAPELKHDLGLPTTNYTPEQINHWATINKSAEEHVLQENPFLLTAPKDIEPPTPRPSWRQWRFMVPPVLAAHGDRSIVFMGQAPGASAGLVGVVSSAWAVAYLSGRIQIPKDIEYQTACETSFIRKRYLQTTWSYQEIDFDAIPVSHIIISSSFLLKLSFICQRVSLRQEIGS